MRDWQMFEYRSIKMAMPTLTTKRVQKTVLIAAATLFVSTHTDRVAGQSVSLVMEQASVQRECAALAKAAAATVPQSNVMITNPRCRPHVLTRMDEIWLAFALASGALAWVLLTKRGSNRAGKP